MVAASSPRGRIVFGDNLDVLRALPDGLARLVYVDPPFNTGGEQRRTRLRTVRDDDGDRTGFKGARYRTMVLGSSAGGTPATTTSASSRRASSRRGASSPPTARSSSTSTPARRTTARSCSTSSSAARSFINEIVWAYDYGGAVEEAVAGQARHHLSGTRGTPRATLQLRRDRPHPVHGAGPGGRRRRPHGARRRPTSGGNTIVSPTGREKTGYPTQKPLRDPRAHRARALAARRPRPRLLRRQRHDRRGGGARWGDGTFWSTATPTPSRVMARRLAWDSPELVGCKELGL